MIPPKNTKVQVKHIPHPGARNPKVTYQNMYSMGSTDFRGRLLCTDKKDGFVKVYASSWYCEETKQGYNWDGSWEKRVVVEDLVNAADVQVVAAYRELVDKIQKEYVVPVCVEHRLRFQAGMGQYYFDDSDGKTLDQEDPRIRDVCRALDVDLGHMNNTVGDLMDHYDGRKKCQ